MQNFARIVRRGNSSAQHACDVVLLGPLTRKCKYVGDFSWQQLAASIHDFGEQTVIWYIARCLLRFQTCLSLRNNIPILKSPSVVAFLVRFIEALCTTEERVDGTQQWTIRQWQLTTMS